MVWIIESQDLRTGLVGQRRFDTEAAFIGAAQHVLEDVSPQFMSATLPDGTMLDEEKLRQRLASQLEQR